MWAYRVGAHGLSSRANEDPVNPYASDQESVTLQKVTPLLVTRHALSLNRSPLAIYVDDIACHTSVNVATLLIISDLRYCQIAFC